jgi:hypothetical protein
LEFVAQLRASLRGAVYGVLGNHDSISRVPDLEALGIAVLLNECIAIRIFPAIAAARTASQARPAAPHALAQSPSMS